MLIPPKKIEFILLSIRSLVDLCLKKKRQVSNYCYYISNFVKKKHVQICFSYKVAMQYLNFASWPTKSDIITIQLFTEKNLPLLLQTVYKKLIQSGT